MATKPDIADLLAWWELDEASGNRADSHASYTLTDNNTVGTAEGGADFNDYNSEYLSNTSTDLSRADEALTITGWVWLDDVTAEHTIVSRWQGASNHRQFWLYNTGGGEYRFYVSNNGTDTNNVANSTKGNTTGEWVFFAVYHDPTANTIGLRINATAATPVAHTTGLSDDTTAPFALGRLTDTFYMDGKEKVVNVWNAVLSSDELDYLYNSGTALSYSDMTITIDSWTVEEAGTGEVALETSSQYEGVNAVKITGDADVSVNPTYIYQDITTVVGISYAVTVYVKGDYKVTLTGDTNTDSETGSAVVWSAVTVTITADDTTCRIRLEPYDDADIAYFDYLTTEETYAAGWEFTKFVGTLHKIYPSSGQFDDPLTECEAHDWVGYLTKQELGIQAIQSDKRADEALTTCLTEFPNQPEDTDFDTGVETFELVFAGDSDTSSMASQFAKYARNEQGRIFTKGDGTLVFEKQGARAANTTSAFTLDGTMENLEVSYNVSNLYNIVSLNMRTTETDAAATTELFTVGKGIKIEAGQEITLTCKFTDPDTGMAVAGTDVVTPVAAPHFGSTRTPANDDAHADLNDHNYSAGGSSLTVDLENTGASDGYLNEFTVLGKRITEYSSISIEKRNADSIDQVGNRRYSNRLDLIEDAGTAEDIVDGILAKYAPSHIDTCRVTVLANMDSDIAGQLIIAEPSTRFTAIESVTGIEKDLYINNIRYQQSDTLLWVTIEAEEV